MKKKLKDYVKELAKKGFKQIPDDTIFSRDFEEELRKPKL